MSKSENQPRVDRTVITVTDTFDDSEDREYWKSCSPAERLRHVELLRRINYGDRATGRLERVLESVWAEWR
jgi:hypothetical protein